MNNVRFTVGLDRGDRTRSEADPAIDAIRPLLHSENIQTHNAIKVVFAVVCTCDQQTFEGLFDVSLTELGYDADAGVSEWKTDKEITIPKNFASAGIVRVHLDAKRNALG